MRLFVLLFLLAQATQSFAQSQPRFESAQAFPGETYEEARARHAKETPNFFDDTLSTATSGGSAYSYKTSFALSMDVSVLPKWIAGAEKLEQAYQRARDEKLYYDRNHPNLKRRATWLYPIDGCYIRASHMARGMERMGYVRPGKVFAFGTWATLRAKTPYAPNGKAWWSFHTAAAYRLGDRAMVLDPAIDPNRILPFEEWVGLIAPDPSKIQVAICDTNAYTPGQTCRGGKNTADYYAKSQMEDYLDDEWRNLVDLGYDPFKLLGDNPPWNNWRSSNGTNAFTLE